MQEYVTEAVVLDAVPSAELDVRVSLFTKKFGKLVARAKSVKKITSKLAGHLEPGNVVKIRLVEKKGLQLVDALKEKEVSINPPDLYLLNQILHEAEPDHELWELLTGGAFRWHEALRILGWDPAAADCAGPHTKRASTPSAQDAHNARSGVGVGHPSTSSGNKVTAFHIKTQEFYCSACASKVRRNEVILL